MCQVSPITKEQLSRGADMRQHSGARVEIPRAPTGRTHRQSFRNSWTQRVTGAGLPLCSWKCNTPDHRSPEPLGLGDVRKASVHMSRQLFSMLFGSLLPGKHCLPPKTKSSSRSCWNPSLEDEEQEESAPWAGT